MNRSNQNQIIPMVLFNNKDALFYRVALSVYQLLSVSYRPIQIIDLANQSSHNVDQLKSCTNIVTPLGMNIP